MGDSLADDDLLVCADVLGAFGVTASDVAREGADDLESALADALATGRDRTAVLQRTIARGDRGVDCDARHVGTAFAAEVSRVLESIGWSSTWEWERADRFVVGATDGSDRRREVTVTYPETPLGTDNLPAALAAIEDVLLEGVDATFVLLSAGVDRWRAALIERDDLERLREAYGDRIAALSRPLLSAHGLEAFVGDERASGDDGAGATPWPEWALDGATGASSGDASVDPAGTIGGLVEEAEPEPATGLAEAAESGGATLVVDAESGTRPGAANSATDTAAGDGATGSSASAAAGTDSAAGPGSTANTVSAESSADSGSATDLELLGGSPTVSRRSSGDGDADATEDDGADDRDAFGRPDQKAGGDARAAETSASDAFGELSGSTTATRVSNDSFGTGVESSASERYLALGAALGSGGDVSVKGLLEDDEFLPEIPAAEPVETRIEFAEAFDPAAVSRAEATAEQEGFEWVDAGSLETTRVSNG